MDLKTYLASLGRGGATRFAERLGISASYLSQLASGKSPISVERSVEIERESGGLVTRQAMHPDSWQAKWPELESQMDRAA